MDCRLAQNELLRLDDLRPGLRVGGELGRHLSACPACREYAAKLIRLEGAVRTLPAPREAEAARQVFIQRLRARQSDATPMSVPAAPRPRRTRWLLSPHWAVAASLLLAFGVVAWLLVPGDNQVAEASPDLVDQLVALNLDLTQAGSLEERGQVYAERAEGLKQAIQQAVAEQKLGEDDRELAEKLLETSSILADNDDPIDHADRFNEVADKLLEKMNSAIDRKNARKIDGLGKNYNKLVEHGINANLDKVQAARAIGPEREVKVARITQRNAERVKALESMAQRAPSSSRKEIKQAIKASEKRNKNKGPHGKKK